MTRPPSVTVAAGLAGLTAALTALLWTATDFASTTATATPPPTRPDGASPEEWERAFTAPSSGPDPEPLTNLELFGLLFNGALIALALTGIVLWLVVAVAAARGIGWARFLAVVLVAGQAWMMLLLRGGSALSVYAVTWAVIVTGAMCAALLWRRESIAHFETRSEPHAAAVPVS